MMSKRIPNITAEFEVHYISKKYGLLRGVSFGGGVSFAGRWQYTQSSLRIIFYVNPRICAVVLVRRWMRNPGYRR
jgi:hypothetical protein